MRLDEVPLFAALGDARRVLIAGAGGGFDVYSGVPLGLALQRRGVEVTWANLSFTYLPATTAEQVDDVTWRVTADLEALPGIYFPELVLAQWLADHDHLGEVFAFDKTGVRQLTAAYRRLAADRQFDAVVVVDGGSDSLLRGTETGLGTPAEDATTLLAADSLADVPVRLLVAAGFGVDAFHGVAHAQVLQAVAELTAARGFFGITSLLPQMSEAAAFIDLVMRANERTPGGESIVANSIASAIQGAYGDVHMLERTRGSTLYINPLMATYLTCSLPAVTRRLAYARHIADTKSFMETVHAIADFRSRLTLPPRPLIPL